MSSKKNLEEDRGDQGSKSGVSASSGSTIASCPSGVTTDDGMKRAAAKQLIEKYYYQLTDGCGRTDCLNDSCASSQKFKFNNLDQNEKAAKAMDLFRVKAHLCHVSSRPFKVPKNGSEPSSHSDQIQDSSVQDNLLSQPPGSSTSTDPSSSSQGTTVDFSVIDMLQQTNSSRLGTGKASAAIAGPSTMDVFSTKIIQGNSFCKPNQTASNQESQLSYLSESALSEILSKCESENNWSKLIRTLGSVFNNPESLMHSFIKEKEQTKEEIRAMDVDMDKDTDEKEERTDGEGMEPMDSCDSDVDGGCSGSAQAPASPRATNVSPQHAHVRLKGEELTVDIDSIRRAFSKLFKIQASPFQSALTNALRLLARTVEMDLRYHQAYDRNPNYLNIFIIVFEILVLDNRGDLENSIPHILKAAGLLPVAAQVRLARIWATFSCSKLKEILSFLHQVITLRILSSQWSSTFTFNDDEGITGAAKVMKILFYASILGGVMDPPDILEREKLASKEVEESLQELLEGAVGREKDKMQPKEDPLGKELGVQSLDCRKPLIPWEDFINDLVSDGIRMERDYTHYKGESEGKFSFLTHSFLLTTALKNLGMYYDSKIRMVNERRVSLLQSLVNGAPTMPYLRIRIRRDHIIDDALVNLEMIAMDNPQDLKKQLYVEFEGEQGIDEGGVSKEFFQLVVEEIFNPDIGMFVYNEENRNFWFNPTSFENDSQFTLIGIVLGLAIYNNVILDVHFPMVVYRKLMGKLGIFDDLRDYDTTLAKSLQYILETELDIEEEIMQTFHISHTDVFGAMISHHLKENGDKIPVTKENRREYVDLYADYLLNKAIEKQFRAFNRGFQMVTDESPLKMLFQPSEVELLVCGSKHWDFQALEQATEYDGGFTSDSPVIKYFWEVVHDFSEEQKRKLLQFTTGSDRVPVGGLAKLKLVIARHGPDSDRLPTAHTCFNVLLLPDYNTKEKLEERLTKAILYAKGFGML